MKKVLLMAIIISTIFGIGLGTFVFSVITNVEKTVFKTSVRSGSYNGFDVNIQELTFATVQPGRNKERNLVVYNRHSYPAEVRISFYGNISKYVTVSESEFMLLSGENRTVSANVQLPEDIPFNNWINGTVEVIVRRKW